MSKSSAASTTPSSSGSPDASTALGATTKAKLVLVTFTANTDAKKQRKSGSRRSRKPKLPKKRSSRSKKRLKKRRTERQRKQVRVRRTLMGKQTTRKSKLKRSPCRRGVGRGPDVDKCPKR